MAVSGGPPTTRVVLGNTVAVLLSVPPIAPAAGSLGGVTTVGLVLAEAIALYVGYDALARFAGPILREALLRE